MNTVYLVLRSVDGEHGGQPVQGFLGNYRDFPVELALFDPEVREVVRGKRIRGCLRSPEKKRKNKSLANLVIHVTLL